MEAIMNIRTIRSSYSIVVFCPFIIRAIGFLSRGLSGCLNPGHQLATVGPGGLVAGSASRNNPFFFKRKQGIPFGAAIDGVAALIEKECDEKSDQNQADKDREEDYVHWVGVADFERREF